MAFTVLALHGPNLSLLAAEQIDPLLRARAAGLGVEVISAQANGEEGMLDALHLHAPKVQAVVVNPGVLAPQAWGLAEALGQLKILAVEVLLGKLTKARGGSALAGVVKQQVHGAGVEGYARALAVLVKSSGKTAPHPSPLPVSQGEGAKVRKTIGRAAAPKGKTIGRGAPTAPAEVPRAGVLSRSVVRDRIALRLKGQLSPDALAAWARDAWTGLQKGAGVESGAVEEIEGALLTLMAGARASDAMLVSQMAKLDQ